MVVPSSPLSEGAQRTLHRRERGERGGKHWWAWSDSFDHVLIVQTQFQKDRRTSAPFCRPCQLIRCSGVVADKSCNPGGANSEAAIAGVTFTPKFGLTWGAARA